MGKLRNFGLWLVMIIPNVLLWLLWTSNLLFLHEMGHVYFAFLTGDSYVIIYPTGANVTIPQDPLGLFIVAMGGVFFTSIATGVLYLLVYLFWSYKGWKIERRKDFSGSTVGFHLLLAIISVQAVEILNLLPFDGSDMAKLAHYLEIPMDVLPDILYWIIGLSLALLSIGICTHFLANLVYSAIHYLRNRQIRTESN